MSLQDIYKNAGVVMKPAAMKDGKLYSQQPHSGAGDFNFSRADGVQTRINKHGLIETVADNVPRLSYDLVDGKVSDCPHLLLEPSRGNSAEYSEDFTNWTASTGVTVAANRGISPDGSQTANSVVTNNVKGTFSDNFSVSNDSNSRTQSIFVKYISGTSDFMLRGAYTGGSSVAKRTKFDISTGSIITTDTTASIENYGNGWYRLSQQITNNSSGNTNLAFQIYTTNDVISTNEWLLWGAQLETGSYVTSYIPNLTTGTTVRSADVCNGSGNSETFNSQSGALFANFKTDPEGGNFLISISDGNSNSGAVFIGADANEKVYGYYNSANHTSSIDSYQDFNKVCVSWDSDGIKFYINGISRTVAGSQSLSSASYDTLKFSRANGTLSFYGKVLEVSTFKESLTDSELEKLTTP